MYGGTLTTNKVKRNKKQERRKVMNEIIRGTFQECMEHHKHHLIRLKPTQDRISSKDCKNIAQFCKVSKNSPIHWFRTGTRPVGTNWFKVCKYLELLGYVVTDIGSDDPVIRKFIDLLGIGILSFEDATKAVGYKKTTTLIDVLRERTGISDEKKGKMWGIVKANKDLIKERTELLQKRFCKNNKIPLPVKDVEETEKNEFSTLEFADRSQPVVCITINLMSTLITSFENNSIVDHFKQSELTANESSAILRLSAFMNELSSVVVFKNEEGGAQ